MYGIENLVYYSEKYTSYITCFSLIYYFISYCYAYMLFSICLYFIVIKDYEKYGLYLIKAYEYTNGNCFFAYLLGIHFFKNKKNFKQAKKYLLLSINDNNKYAMCALANIYYIEKNYEKAKIYFLLSVDKNCIDAMYYLGIYYYNIHNYKKANNYFIMLLNNYDKAIFPKIRFYNYQQKSLRKLLKSLILMKDFDKYKYLYNKYNKLL